MLYLSAVLIVVFSLFGSQPVGAALMERPKVEFSADSIIQTETGSIQQKIFVTPTKERKEMLTGAGDGGVQIFRFDTKVMWMLMPSERMYMEHSMTGGKSQRDDPAQWTYEDTAVGDETLNGVPVTKFKTIATSTDGKKYGGFSWRTKDGINLKQDLLYKEGNDKKRMLIELRNLKVGKQDPALFEIPDGFTKFDMAGMMGGMMGREGMGQRGMPQKSRPQTGRTVPVPTETPSTPDTTPAQEEPSDIEKAGNLMKGLFGK